MEHDEMSRNCKLVRMCKEAVVKSNLDEVEVGLFRCSMITSFLMYPAHVLSQRLAYRMA
jgi:hypothetical protein